MNKFIKTLAVAALLLSMAGAAHASNIDINIYGIPSAFQYWTDAADNLLTAKGCTGVSQAQAADGKHGITCGTCGGNYVCIRYTSKNSLDGIRSVKGTSTGGSCTDPYQRDFCSSVSTPNTFACLPVTLGASDAAGESFVQESHGQKYGPRGGGQYDVVLSGEDTSMLVPYQPLAVPFVFFVNKAITHWVCKAGSPANEGGYCQSDKHCGGTYNQFTYCDGSATKTIDNISRPQAVNIFAGYVTDWSDFGAYYTAQPIVLCHLHAGSGILSTLDFCAMRGNGWGEPLTGWEEIGAPWTSDRAIWFNESSSDLIKCVNGNYKLNGTGSEVLGSLIGAIGYGDADQAVGVQGTSQNVVAIRYQGFEGTRYNVRNGTYPCWSKRWFYEHEARTSPAQDGWIDNLMVYASDPDNVPSIKSEYWAAADEMKCRKDTDRSYPYFTGAVDPQFP